MPSLKKSTRFKINILDLLRINGWDIEKKVAAARYFYKTARPFAFSGDVYGIQWAFIQEYPHLGSGWCPSLLATTKKPNIEQNLHNLFLRLCLNYPHQHEITDWRKSLKITKFDENKIWINYPYYGGTMKIPVGDITIRWEFFVEDFLVAVQPEEKFGWSPNKSWPNDVDIYVKSLYFNDGCFNYNVYYGDHLSSHWKLVITSTPDQSISEFVLDLSKIYTSIIVSDSAIKQNADYSDTYFISG